MGIDCNTQKARALTRADKEIESRKISICIFCHRKEKNGTGNFETGARVQGTQDELR